jgi:hypothetical protein
VQALKAGEHGDLVALLEAFDEFGAVDVENAGGGVSVGRQDRQLPALPRAGIDAQSLEHNGQQSGGNLLARGHHRIVFARVVQGRRLAAPGHQPIGCPGHGRDHDRHLMAGVDLALDVSRDIVDVLDIGNRSAAEFHNQAGHGGLADAPA